MKKALLLSFICVVLLALGGCSSSSTPTTSASFLYAGNSTSPGSVAAFTDTSGALTHIGGSPFPTLGNPPLTLAAVSTKFLYGGVPAVNGELGGIILLPIQTDGVLGAAQLFASGNSFDGIAVTPDGKFLYAANVASSHVLAFSINSTSGVLTAVGPPAGVSVGADPFNLAVDPQGKYVFVAGCSCAARTPAAAGNISVFAIQGDGTLQAVNGSPFALPGPAVAHPMDLVVSPDGTLLFVASLADSSSENDQVFSETIASDGTLSSAGTPAALPIVGSFPSSIAVSNDGKFVYTGDTGTGSVSQFDVGAGGVLTHHSDFTMPTAGAPGKLLAHPSAGFLYATDFDHGTVVIFSIASNGTLTQSGSPVNTSGLNPFGLAFAH